MWFLQTDILLKILSVCALACLASYLAAKHGKQALAVRFLALFDLAVICLVDWRLGVFYTAYTLVTWGIAGFIRRVKRFRRTLFVICCLLCTAPFFYSRATGFLSGLPLGFALVGFAYNMLKAVDAVYYCYYTEEKIPFVIYANYMLFLPVFTAGPIFRYRDFQQTFLHPDPITLERITESVKRFIRGMFKKLVVQSLAFSLLTKLAQAGPHWHISLAAIILSYAVIWLDMSGYADIAIALGGAMGLQVPENFNRPLTAPSMTQFWRNWHITLSSWIREHVFVVLNGKRLTRWQGALVSFFTMFFMGLWHSFALQGLLDGLFYGTIMGCEALFGIATVNKRKTKKSVFVLRCVLTNFLFALGTLSYTLGMDQVFPLLRGLLRL